MDRDATIVAEVDVVIETPDAEAMRKALKSFFRDDTALIGIISKQTRAGLYALAQAYKSNFGRDLLEDIEGDTSGEYRKVFEALFARPGEMEAKACHKAMSGIGTNENVLIEMLCGRSNAELAIIKEQYKAIAGKDLEKALESDLSARFKRFMVMCIQGTRDEVGVDEGKAAEDAKVLHKAEGRFSTDDDVFMMMMANRSYHHLHAVAAAYANLAKKTLEEAIKSDFSSHLQSAILTTLRRGRGANYLSAMQLYEGLRFFGTDDGRVIRQFAIHHGHLKAVAEAYNALYGKKLIESLKSDTSGNFSKILCRLIETSPQ